MFSFGNIQLKSFFYHAYWNKSTSGFVLTVKLWFQISATHGFDSKGQTTVQTDMYCTVRNNKKVKCKFLDNGY